MFLKDIEKMAGILDSRMKEIMDFQKFNQDFLRQVRDDIRDIRLMGESGGLYSANNIQDGNQDGISDREFPKIFIHNVSADVESAYDGERLTEFEIRYEIEYTAQTRSGNSHDSSVYLSFDKTPNAEDIELAIKEDLLSI